MVGGIRVGAYVGGFALFVGCVIGMIDGYDKYILGLTINVDVCTNSSSGEAWHLCQKEPHLFSSYGIQWHSCLRYVRDIRSLGTCRYKYRLIILIRGHHNPEW